jgi:hypothetical protein
MFRGKRRAILGLIRINGDAEPASTATIKAGAMMTARLITHVLFLLINTYIIVICSINYFLLINRYIQDTTDSLTCAAAGFNPSHPLVVSCYFSSPGWAVSMATTRFGGKRHYASAVTAKYVSRLSLPP